MTTFDWRSLPTYYSGPGDTTTRTVLAEQYGQLCRLQIQQLPAPLSVSEMQSTDYVLIDRGILAPMRIPVTDFIKCLRRIEEQEQQTRAASLPKARSVVTPSPMFNREIDID